MRNSMQLALSEPNLATAAEYRCIAAAHEADSRLSRATMSSPLVHTVIACTSFVDCSIHGQHEQEENSWWHISAVGSCCQITSQGRIAAAHKDDARLGIVERVNSKAVMMAQCDN